MAVREITQQRLERAIAQVKMARACRSAWLSTDAVLILTGWSSPTLYRHIQLGKFPAGICRGKWQGGEVLDWLNQRASASAGDIGEKRS